MCRENLLNQSISAVEATQKKVTKPITNQPKLFKPKKALEQNKEKENQETTKRY